IFGEAGEIQGGGGHELIERQTQRANLALPGCENIVGICREDLQGLGGGPANRRIEPSLRYSWHGAARSTLRPPGFCNRSATCENRSGRIPPVLRARGLKP